MKMLFELAIEEEILSIPNHLKEELYGKILTNCDLDIKILQGNVEDISFNEIYEQYFESMKQVVDAIMEKDSIEEKISFVENLLNLADLNIKYYNDSETLQRINGRHIQNYQSALVEFKDNNFIFI